MILDKTIVSKAKEAEKAFGIYSQQISNRIDEVVHSIANCFGTKCEWWDYKNGGENVNGHFQTYMIEEDVLTLTGTFRKHDLYSLLKDDKIEWDFTWFQIPTRFLFEDFEKELKDGIKLSEKRCKEKLEEDKKKLEDKKRKKALEISEIKKKLTPQERKLLGI